MTAAPYRIAGLSAWKDEFVCLMEPLLVAAKALGHDARRVAVGTDATEQVLSIVKAQRIDFCLVTGRTVLRFAHQIPTMFPALREAGVPVVVLWYDNPLRYLDDLKAIYDENILLLTTIDTKCLEELRALGFDRTAYFPIWSVTPNFRPEPPAAELSCDVSFAGGYMSREYFETVYLPKCLQPIHALLVQGDRPEARAARRLIDEFVAIRQATGAHVDVYEFLRDRTSRGPCTRLFHVFSVLLMNYQKILEREQLFDAVLRLPDATLQCFGGADVVLNKTEAMASRWDRVRFHPALDKRTGVQQVYNSTAINLGVSQFPRAVHNRYFECAACGGFMIGERKRDLDGLFDVGKEIVCFESLDELPDLIRFYRGHEAERKRIGAAARRRVLRQHLPPHRMRQLLPLVEAGLERFRDVHKVTA